MAPGNYVRTLKTEEDLERFLVFTVNDVCDLIERVGYLRVLTEITKTENDRILQARRRDALKQWGIGKDDSDTDPRNVDDPFDDREPRL